MEGSFSRFPRLLAAAALASLTATTVLWAGSARAQADSEDEDLIGYDVIVKELSQKNEAPSRGTTRSRLNHRTSDDPFANVLIHFGAGYATSMQTLTFENGPKAYLSQKGFQAALGIDLFSENWMAEGTARSFGDGEDGDTRVSLKEFDLKIFYKDRFSPNLGFRAGGGLSARYMTLHTAAGSMDYTTPSSVGTLGLDLFLSKGFSLGLDLSARNTMVAETMDQSSYDATLRMDTHF